MNLQPIIQLLESGQPVLVAGLNHPGIPTIQDVGPGRTLATDGEVRHAGFGVFLARVGTHDISFCAGGAMERVMVDEEWQYSYTTIGADSDQLARMGYDIPAVLARVRERELEAQQTA